MKTFILMAAFVICLTTNLSAQTKDRAEVNATVTESFSKHFNGASLIQWHKAKGASVAIFAYKEGSWMAYFSQDGKLLASAKKIRDISQLPIAVQESLATLQRQGAKKDNGPLEIGFVYEVLPTHGDTFYYVPMQNANQSLVASISANGYASINKKENRMPAAIDASNKSLLAKKN
jgi:hypothetical protein